MARTQHITRDGFVAIFGEKEVRQIAGQTVMNDRGRSVEVIDEDVLQRQLDVANAQAEAHVTGRYPAGTTHPTIERAAADIARFHLRHDTSDPTVSDEVRKRYQCAKQVLKDIADGLMNLTDENGEALGVDEGSPAGSVLFPEQPTTKMAELLARWPR